MISVVIVDDEPKARETIAKLLALSPVKVNVIGAADDIASGFETINHLSPQLVLLDINLPDGTGFDLLKKFEKINFQVVFITAHEEYAIQAFKCSALDYVLKPINSADLFRAIERANERLSNDEMAGKLNVLLSNLDKLRKIVLKTAESIHIINVDNIIRCESDVNYTTFFLINGKRLLVSKPLKDYDELLCPAGFFRTHQSHLINLDHMLRYDKNDGGYIVMDDNSPVPVSTRRKEALFELFGKM
ncbi:MAG: LytTR family DNA-binding domain-containing protein [Lentimicrobium sp.]|jgi:two-component system LytT family response regulator|nr:LytTR family DNA-binding domain-containing protein [Lentimicrobium sp.]